MMRASVITDRLRRRGRQEGTTAAGQESPPGGPRIPSAPVTGGTKTGERPYADITDSQLAAYRLAAASEGTAPKPEFHPARSAAPVTAPMAVLPVNAAVPPPPPAPAAGEEMVLLRRVRDAMDRKWRAESFIADRQELPRFAAMTREYGWTGLHVPVRSLRQFSHQRWTTERWFRQALAAIEAATEAARAEDRADLDAIEARAAGRLSLIGGAR